MIYVEVPLKSFHHFRNFRKVGGFGGNIFEYAE